MQDLSFCLVTVKCQFQLHVGNLKIRPDLETCDKMQAMFIDVQLPDPVADLLGIVPEIEKLPFYSSKATAGVELLKRVRAELIRGPQVSTANYLLKIAEQITMDMSSLTPSLKSHFSEYVPVKMSLSLTLIVFIGNILLHVLLLYAYHKIKILQRLVPSVLKYGVEIAEV